MITIRTLDINAVYEAGYDTILLSRHWHERLCALVHSDPWAEDPEGVFLKVPAWTILLRSIDPLPNKADQERAHNQRVLDNAPKALLEGCQELIECPSIMGIWKEAFSAKLRFLSLWNGAEDLDWHWDGPARAGFFFLIYLNKKNGWPENGGGELKTGVRNLHPGYLRTSESEISELATIKPASRTLVCCNNQNPRFVHKVLPLREADERTVLMIGFDMVPTMLGM